MKNNNYASEYISSVRKQFEYYKSLGEKTMSQVTDKQLFEELGKDTNSMAIIAKHIAGNQLSRWTDFLTTDGEKEWRNREAEFELESLDTREKLMELWQRGWSCLFNAIDSIDEDNFNELVYIRNMGHSIPEALNRQLCHYSYHVGQMVFLGKVLRGEHWESLSIPKGKSASYNAEKFSKSKSTKHFTEDL